MAAFADTVKSQGLLYMAVHFILSPGLRWLLRRARQGSDGLSRQQLLSGLVGDGAAVPGQHGQPAWLLCPRCMHGPLASVVQYIVYASTSYCIILYCNFFAALMSE